MDWFRRYVAGFRLRSSTISKLEYIIGVSVEIESCRTKRNFPSPANQIRKQVASEARYSRLSAASRPLSSQLLSESRPSIEWIQCEKLVENPVYDREIWSHSPLPTRSDIWKLRGRWKIFLVFSSRCPLCSKKKKRKKRHGNASKLTIYSCVKVNKLELPNHVKLISLVFFFFAIIRNEYKRLYFQSRIKFFHSIIFAFWFTKFSITAKNN